ncbi:MAG: C40 family peptidase [Oscillospiraceae bacterium]|nr:C40 family peptidase [Oscillospiraceae bacterium]
MAMKTSEGLLAHARSLLGSPYMWGTYGKTITKELIADKAKQYPTHYTAAYRQKLLGYVGSGKRAVDCVGLIKAYMMTDGIGGDPVYQAAYDKNVAGMREACSPLERLTTLPELPGILVFVEKSHTGIYLGCGDVIEAVGSDCVRVTALSKGKWTHWGKLRWLAYPELITPDAPTKAPFANTTGGDLAVFAETNLRQRIGTLPAGSSCHTLGKVNGRRLLLYRVSGTQEYKTGFISS